MKQIHEIIPYLTLFAVLLTFSYIFIQLENVDGQLDRIEARQLQAS